MCGFRLLVANIGLALAVTPGWGHNDTMNIAKYTEQLQGQLAAAAKSGSPAAQEAAEHLAAALEPAARLMVTELLAEATDEISKSLDPGSVDVRVRGKKATFTVQAPQGPEVEKVVAQAVADAEAKVEAAADAEAQAHAAEEAQILADVAAAAADEATSRTTIRLPDALKQRAQEAANQRGVSLNTWVTRAVSLYLKPGPKSRRGRAAARYTGWVD